MSFTAAAAAVALTVAAPIADSRAILQPTAYMCIEAVVLAWVAAQRSGKPPTGAIPVGAYLGFLSTSIVLFRLTDPPDDVSDVNGVNYPLFAWWLAIFALAPPLALFVVVRRLAIKKLRP